MAKLEASIVRSRWTAVALVAAALVAALATGCGQETADEHIEKLHREYEAATERQHDAERDLYGEYNGEAADRAEKERQRGRELRAYSCSQLEAQAQSDDTPTRITAEIALEESDCG